MSLISVYWYARYVQLCGQAPRLLIALQWRYNDHDDSSNHQSHGCLLNRLFRRRSKKTSKLSVTGLYMGNSPGPVNSPKKGPVTREMFPFDDVIMDINWHGYVITFIVLCELKLLIHAWLQGRVSSNADEIMCKCRITSHVLNSMNLSLYVNWSITVNC